MATTIYTNGVFYTQDPDHPMVEAVVAADGFIVDVGNQNEMIDRWGQSGAAIKDLKGKFVTPGLIDSHLHLSGIAMKFLSVDLSNVTSKRELLQTIKQKADETPAGQWIEGRGWDENRFTDRSLPTREELDQVAPENPIFLTRVCGHVFLVNSKALEAANYAPDKDVPAGGTVVLDADTGNPTGLLLETASEIIREHIPAPTYQQLKDSLRQAITLAMQKGLTSVHTEDLRYFGGLEQTYKLYDELLNQEKLGLRCNLLIYYPYVRQLKELNMYAGYGNSTLQIGAVKIFADGSFGGRTAYLSKPYADDPTNLGSEIHDEETLYQLFQEAREAELPIAVHTIGDLALDHVLTTLERFEPVNYRDRIIHTSLVRPDLLARLNKPSIVADIQPRFVVGDFPWVVERVGEDRAQQCYMWKTMIASGIICAGGSDAPVEPVEPLLGIHAAVTRRRPHESHEGYNPDEKLTIEEAIRLFTIGGAYATNEEHLKGTLSRGKFADMTVYSRNLLTMDDPDELLTTDIEMTIIHGEICYENGL